MVSAKEPKQFLSQKKKKKQQQPLFKAVLSIYAAITSCKKQKKTKKLMY